MLYIENKQNHGITIEVNDKEKGRFLSFFFDSRRVYKDTGNLLSTGITEVSDSDYELIKGQKVFSYLVNLGQLVVHKTNPITINETKIGKLEEENVKMKKQIQELQEKIVQNANKDESKSFKEKEKELNKQLEVKDNEIEELKKKLAKKQKTT